MVENFTNHGHMAQALFYIFCTITFTVQYWKVRKKAPSPTNYGHDDFIIGLFLDTTPHVEEQLLISGAKHPQTWNCARFLHLMR